MTTIGTRTLAELYLTQGHPGRALEILHKLQAERPDDGEIRELLERAEAQQREASLSTGNKAGVLPSPAEADEPSLADTVDEPNERALSSVPARSAGPESLRDKAIDLGSAVVEHVATKAIDRLTRILEQVRERRRW